MNKPNLTIMYGKKRIEYSVVHSNRKTLEIAVHPNKSIVVTAPQNCEPYKIREKIIQRVKWINKQLKYYQQFEPFTPTKQYLRGETHLYLGRQYRLKIKSGLAENVKLIHGYFQITLRNKEDRIRIKELLYSWYDEKAIERYNEYFNLCWNSFDKPNRIKPILKIRRMKKRWGSLSKNGTLTLNFELIKAPKECIEYVITHELCHTIHHNHSPEFYNLLEKVMPNWKKIKHKLELRMS